MIQNLKKKSLTPLILTDLIVEVLGHDLEMRRLFHLFRTLHPEADVRDPADRFGLPELLLHHLVQFLGLLLLIICFNRVTKIAFRRQKFTSSTFLSEFHMYLF